MDLAGHRTDAFSRLKNEFETFLKSLGFVEISVVAVSAITGDMVVRRDSNMPWFEGYTLLQTLASKRIRKDSSVGFRFLVQRVDRVKFGLKNDLHGYCTWVESGSIFVADELFVLPFLLARLKADESCAALLAKAHRQRLSRASG